MSFQKDSQKEARNQENFRELKTLVTDVTKFAQSAPVGKAINVEEWDIGKLHPDRYIFVRTGPKSWLFQSKESYDKKSADGIRVENNGNIFVGNDRIEAGNCGPSTMRYAQIMKSNLLSGRNKK